VANKAPAGAPAWMVTFADLMVLLLVLFVLLLTFAELDIQRFKAMAGAVREAFGVAKEDKLAGVIELEGSKRRTAATDTSMVRRPDDIPKVSIEAPMESDAAAETDAKPANQPAEKRDADELAGALKQAIAAEIAGSGIQIERSGGGVVVRFPNSIAFPSGSGDLTPAFIAILNKLAPVLRKTPGTVFVSGHTDNVPISSRIYRSNWDLSAARAASVVHHMIDANGIQPARITVQGYGDSRPQAPNDTPENRAKNRRVEISVVPE